MAGIILEDVEAGAAEIDVVYVYVLGGAGPFVPEGGSPL